MDAHRRNLLVKVMQEKVDLQEAYAEAMEAQARTQEWLDRFQGVAAAQALTLARLAAFLVDVDSVTSLVAYRYSARELPEEVVVELKRVSTVAREEAKKIGAIQEGEDGRG